MVTEQDVIDALRECYDPEVPVNIVDLGLVYGVHIDDGKVHVKMTLTAPGCPMHSLISEDAKKKVEQLEGVEKAEVEIVWEPLWTPERMSPEAKKKLGML
ncbi:MAG: iron-sulfur cluster assembly protein [Candidatus Thermoplasmatota archaeon]|nr:iron-sulfur cluster assembly protein [Candidatus Thermoplasmatota archaeon]